jgi:hypothetical protein
MMEAVSICETSVSFYQATRRNFPEIILLIAFDLCIMNNIFVHVYCMFNIVYYNLFRIHSYITRLDVKSSHFSMKTMCIKITNLFVWFVCGSSYNGVFRLHAEQ